ncbi:MAG: Kelch repeat type 2-containing protein, partial [Burkholderiales bacterium]|nr:Kelch repeat type 2-containing protein [Burkholderiales bacterium]
SGLWTWASGSNLIDQNGIYGIKGGESASNMPGSRNGSVSWIDTSGNLWFFGGTGRTESSNGYLNDLWKYNPGSGLWTWASGSNLIDQNGIYGIKGGESASNMPGSRSARVSWIDASGNMWLFGGFGIAESGNYGSLNDLWKYNPDSGLWTWVSGSKLINQNGIYGVRGEESASNIPGGRWDSISWIDTLGNLWFFGGNGRVESGSNGYLNDLWKYHP